MRQFFRDVGSFLMVEPYKEGNEDFEVWTGVALCFVCPIIVGIVVWGSS